jgi:membrane-bound ClpP family serine protease
MHFQCYALIKALVSSIPRKSLLGCARLLTQQTRFPRRFNQHYPCFSNRFQAAALVLVGCFLLMTGATAGWGFVQAQEQGAAERAEGNPVVAGVPGERHASLLRVALPLTSETESRILASLESFSGQARGVDRPIVILEFVAANPAAQAAGEQAPSIGQGTSFEKALSLARWLSGPKGSRIKSVGYVNQNLRGHGVLIALACEELVVLSDAELGLAGIDEPQLEPTVVQAYLDVASKRGMIPLAAVRSMLDPAAPLVQLDLEGGGIEFTSVPDLESKGRPEGAWRERQLVPTNKLATFTGQEMRQWRWIAHAIAQPELLQAALKLSSPPKEKASFALPRHPALIQLRGVLHRRMVTRTIRAIDDAISNEGADLIFLEIDSPGGSFEESMRLAFHLAKISNDRAEVVAYVSGYARGDAALIPLAADLVYMAPEALLGTGGEASIRGEDIEQNKQTILEFASLAKRNPGDVVGLIYPSASVHEFFSADGRRERNVAGWIQEPDPNRPLWKKGQAVDFNNGIGVDRAIEMGIVADRELDLASVATKFMVSELPMEKQTSRLERGVEWLASQRWLTFVLFLVGMICLSAEVNSPGLGVPGLISLVCFLFFFWINLFQGTIEWLEILLILGGVICLLAEIFVLPGFGIFGVAGLVMLAIGLLLAGQTFTFPTNSYQWGRSINGLGQMGFGVIVLAVVGFLLRNQLAKLPMVRWFALEHPTQDRFVVAMERMSEERQMLKGIYGTTTTRCNPYGKAILGDQLIDVVSQGGWIEENMPIEVLDVKDTHVIIRKRRI